MNAKRIARRIVALSNVFPLRCESCGKTYDNDESKEEPCPTCGAHSQPCPACGNWPGGANDETIHGIIDDERPTPEDEFLAEAEAVRQRNKEEAAQAADETVNWFNRQ